jgi:hypothetical protein
MYEHVIYVCWFSQISTLIPAITDLSIYAKLECKLLEFGLCHHLEHRLPNFVFSPASHST